MYLTYWGMERRPFENDHDPTFFVPDEAGALALAKLRYVALEERGLALLSGPAGCGKTMIARMLLSELDGAGWQTATLDMPYAGSAELLALAAHRLGAPAGADSAVLDRLATHLTALRGRGRRAVMLVEDAHAMEPVPGFLALRSLLHLEAGGEPLLQVILAGQAELSARLRAVPALEQQVALRVRLGPMALEETKRYILYRLKIAGCTRGIFTRQAGALVHELSGGIPRNVNRLCELALVTGYGLGEEKVGPEIVEMAGRELGLDGESEPGDPEEVPAVAVEVATEEDILGSTPVVPAEPEEDILAGLATGELAQG